MPDFRYRSAEPEMMDSPVSDELLFRNLRELEFLNHNFGGHSVSIAGLKKLIQDPAKTYHIIDLGCGSGDTIRYVAEWARRENRNVRLTGVDINPAAIRLFNKLCAAYPEITGMCADYRDLIRAGTSADIFHCALFCHHLADTELSGLFDYFRGHAYAGFVINDLYRGRIGYYGSKIITRFGKGTQLAKNDGPVSVLKGFRMAELKKLLNDASIENFEILRVWLYRILIYGYTGKKM
jgi:SAM-dependent methyltransferase